MVGYLMGGVLCGLSLIKSKSKYIYFLLFLYAWVLFGLNTDNVDLNNYKGRFIGGSGLISEPIFLGMMKVFRKLGFQYQGFLAVYALICLILLSVLILKLSPNPAAVLCLYLIFPFCLDTVQIRFFLASSIFILASGCLIRYQNDRKGIYIVLFFGLLLIASGVHYSAALFAICAVLFLDEKRHGFLQYILVPCALIIVPVMLPSLIELISPVIGMKKANSWIGEITVVTATRAIRLFVVRGEMVLLCLIAKHLPWERDPYYGQNKKEQKIDHVLFMLMLYSMLFAFMEVFLSEACERMTRPGLLFGYIYLTRRIYPADRTTRVAIWILIGGIAFVNFYTNMFLGVPLGWTDQFHSIFLNMFQNNLLFSRL